MDKKRTIIIIAVIAGVLLVGLGTLAYFYIQKNAENEEMLKLAEMDKKEMENEYASFARQYSEMKTQINNDSLIAQLDKEVVFIGMGKRAEIWDKQRWVEKNTEVEENIEDIASDMEASGFSI